MKFFLKELPNPKSREEWGRNRLVRYIILTGILSVVFVPGFHYIFKLIPDVQPDSMTVRLAGAGVSFLVLLIIFLVPGSERFASYLQLINASGIFVTMAILLVDSGFHKIYFSGGMIVVICAQLAFVRFRELLGVSIIAMLALVGYSVYFHEPDWLSILVYGTGLLIGCCFGFFRMRGMENEFNILQALRKEKRQHSHVLIELNKVNMAQKDNLKDYASLKEKQDSDYFLTSMLLEPLAVSDVKSGFVKVDSVMEQKKQLKFRRWDVALGGDICIAYEILLQNKMYIVFLNGDAMGKSLQGAGGALVLGAVFKSLVERALNEQSVKNMSPEIWLKKAFVELHRVFESFNGAMLITVIMGLLDEESGLMYYLNAAHPEMVLYRGGRAQFIRDFVHEDDIVQKLGTQGLDRSIRISLYQLYPGDLLFLGSDGRDDVILGKDFRGNPLVNTDEEMFREIVEEAKGDLNTVYDLLKNKGQLLDDLSLMRISISPSRAGTNARPTPEDAQRISDDKHAIRRSYKNKEYQTAARLGEAFLNEHPEQTSYLYLVSMAYKKLGEFQKATEFGERLLIRKPENLKNLLNLCDIYLKTGNVMRAHVILKRAQGHFPDNEHVGHLHDTILEALSNMKFHLN